MHALTQTLCHSLKFLPCVELSLRFRVLGRDLAACLSHKVSKASVISFTPADFCFTLKENSNTQRKSTKDHTCLCMRRYWSPCLCHGKNIRSASLRPVCLCGMMLGKRAHVIKDDW